MADRAEKSRRDRREPHPLAVLAGVLAAFLLLAACYVGYQALHILFPQNVYETALPATVSDNVEADGVLLFDEVYVSGSGMLGYLAADGERVSAGTAVAEIYSDASQASRSTCCSAPRTPPPCSWTPCCGSARRPFMT